MITLTREEAQQVLDAIVLSMPMFAGHNKQHTTAIETLRARLAQPEPEPVAWEYCGALFHDKEEVFAWHERGDIDSTPPKPFYTAPPQREWQGLTDDEVIECMKTVPLTSQDRVMGYIRAVEQQLKEKNG